MAEVLFKKQSYLWSILIFHIFFKIISTKSEYVSVYIRKAFWSQFFFFFWKKLSYANRFPTKSEKPGQLIWRVTGFRPQERWSCQGLSWLTTRKLLIYRNSVVLAGEMPGDPKIGWAPGLLTDQAPSTEQQPARLSLLKGQSKHLWLHRLPGSSLGKVDSQVPGAPPGNLQPN